MKRKWKIGDVWLGRYEGHKEPAHFRIVAIWERRGEVEGFIAIMLEKLCGYPHPAFWFDNDGDEGFDDYTCDLGVELYRKSRATAQDWWYWPNKWKFG